ncbi:MULTISPECIES: S41 family peptidase [unclassified Treponema]|uniref:S41 family peptidase n=1 Tax=unclassified Treponema TaxID=2638727 RepID=UPI0020A49EAA|nr:MULTISPECIES: S41 family peptidase [unclassified Treponema]UTC67192.1 S41 family peptidase [Treponema sp. OMZ 789]UTC69922.1 S41 family peptidase [Treponema sp. OMZ 790]UTC72637.1 S41 family peptidase [Treponema sp. OMZ 791]
MKKKKLILKTVEFSLVLLFIITSLIISKKNDTVSGFISEEKMKADYEYFWDFIYNGYPFTEVCERKGIDLSQIRQTGYRYLSDPMMQHGYYFFYDDLCRKITRNIYIGHLYPSDYFDYKNAFKKTSLSALYLEQLPLIDNFYNKMPKTGAFTDKSDTLYAGNLKNINPPLIGARKYSKPYIKIIDTGHIAYIKINSFYITNSNEKQEYRKIVDKFFMETADYKHIIIDITNNGGGYTSNYEVLITPNLKANKAIFTYSLYNENKYILPVLNYWLKNDPSTVELIEKSEVPNVENCGTIKNDKAVKIKDSLASKPIFGYKPCEDKKFWLLVSSDSYSAADRFTDICKKTGFATVVGDRTGGAGVNGYYPSFIVLPNSGLLIKFDFMYGLTEDGYCTDEFGTAPDIYNLPGKDALETCLETIKNLGERTNF